MATCWSQERPDRDWLRRRVCAVGSLGCCTYRLAPEVIVKNHSKLPVISVFTPIKITPSKPYKENGHESSAAFNMTPEIVSELDKHIVGQKTRKAVALAMRNRWRRSQLPRPCASKSPQNILMMGPTGVGKTEIARRLARLAGAPFIKVEATKFSKSATLAKMSNPSSRI